MTMQYNTIHVKATKEYDIHIGAGILSGIGGFIAPLLGKCRLALLTDSNVDALYGNAIEGYDSGKLFGDSVDRTVDFEKKLADLAGQEVRLEISMSDAELYSFKFEEIPAII